MRRSDQRQAYDELLGVIRGIRRRWRFRVALQGMALTGVVALAGLVAGSLIVARWEAAPDVVLAVRVALAVLVAAAAAVFLVRPLLRRVSDEAVALYLEEHEPSLEAAALSALEADPGSGLAGTPLLTRTLETAVRRCRAVEDGRYLEQKQLVRVSAALAALLLVGALVGFMGPTGRGVAALLNRAAEAATAGSADAPAVLVDPGNATVPRGADVSVSARLRALDADLVELVVRPTGDSAADRLAMAAGPEGRFGYLLFDVDHDTDYWVEAGGVRAGPFRLTVAELPYVDRLDLELVYPAYTGLPARTVEDGGDVAAIRGTVVRVTATPTIPVEGGAIAVDGAEPVPLVPDSTGALTGSFTVGRDGFYHILLAGPDGTSVEASQRYVIDALSDGGPMVSFAEPGRDERATAIDELYVEARAEDDYGIAALTLHYAVNGGDERAETLYGGRGALEEVSAGHTFYLEEYGLEPGDLVAYWATASDNDAVAGRKEASSDIYFIRIRPFSRDYTAAEQAGVPQGGQPEGGAPDGELSERQRQIIAGTFNLVRDGDDRAAEELRENLNTLVLAQERLREETRTLAQRMVMRQVTRDSAFRQIAELLPRAAEEMERAEASLRSGEPRDALAPEQRALVQLQRAEAIFREVQVSMGQQEGGQSGGSSPMSDDLADLFELERDQLQDRYETVDRGGGAAGDSTSAAMDEVSERLEELARRQQREVERQRQEAMRGRGTPGGDAQRALADEVEEEARRLERLSRERSQPELAEAASRLRDAAESMRRTAAGGDEGERARDRLREAGRALERGRSEGLRRDARQLQDRAEELAREQREIRSESESLLGEEPGGDRDSRLRSLDARKQDQQEEVAGLERELRQAAEAAAGEEPEAARQLREAAGEVADRRIGDKIDFSRQLRRGAAPDRYVRELEERIEEDLDAVASGLAGVDEAFRDRAGDEERERTLEQARDLARGLESMRQRTEELRDRQSGSPGGGTGFAPGASRQQRSEAGRRLEDAEELRQRMRGQGLETDAADELVEGLRGLTGEGPYGDAEELARIQTALADQAKGLELALRAHLTGTDRLRLFLSGASDVDPEFRALVEAYYRSLSRDDSGG